MLQGVLDLGRGGTFQSRTERDIVVRTSLARLEQLDIGDQALYFGRIDRLPEPGVESTSANPLLGESFHIGRLAVSGPVSITGSETVRDSFSQFLDCFQELQATSA